MSPRLHARRLVACLAARDRPALRKHALRIRVHAASLRLVGVSPFHLLRALPLVASRGRLGKHARATPAFRQARAVFLMGHALAQ